MAKCDVCDLNPEGHIYSNHCVNLGMGCKFCSHRCRKDAFYIGGMNICVEHATAFHHRMLEAYEHKAKENMA